MIRRTNKIASVLVAIAAISVVSPIQAKAQTYPRVPSEEGTIYEAAAYKDGKFYIHGKTEDVETKGVYYLNGGKYTEITDIDFETEYNGTYSDKYVEMSDGDYYLDMSNGEISESSFADNAIDDAAIALRKNVRNTAEDRYFDLSTDLVEIPRTKFGGSWYETNYDGYTVYTDSKGNFIDADYNLGKIKVVTTSSNVITLTNTEDEKEGITVYVSDSDVLGQDADYIYRTIKVTIESDEVISKVNTIDVNSGDAFDTSEKDGKTVSFLAIQKISKEQSQDTINGANYAKTAVTYVLSGTDGTSVSLLDNAKISIAGGYIVEYIEECGLLTIQTISLYDERGNQNYVYAYNVDSEEITDIDMDINGNLWKVKDGIVYKFDNYSEWDKMYKVDGSIDRLSVYDENHMIIWSEDDDVYSIKINDTKDATSEEAGSEEVLAGKLGWIQNGDGSWSYNKVEGTRAVGWLYDINQWYYLNPSGIMQTGWIKENNSWYYLNTSGEMLYDTIIDGYILGVKGDLIQ